MCLCVHVCVYNFLSMHTYTYFVTLFVPLHVYVSVRLYTYIYMCLYIIHIYTPMFILRDKESTTYVVI